MAQSKEADAGNSPEFKWGKQLKVNNNIGEIRYFESFMYDGVEYFLNDCAYFYNKDDENQPYIGKIVKIWDHPKVPKRVNIVWFFLPNEMRNWLEGVVLKDKEIFLACGEGVGLSNDNKLEAVVGKCNVVCTSKDKRNPQPSEEELMVADYIFYRTFDVGKFTISDKLGDKIAEIDVRCFLNKGEPQRVRPDPIGPELKRTTVSGLDQRGKTSISQGEDKAKLNSLKTSQHLGSLKNSTLGEYSKHKPKEVPRDSSSLRVEKESNATTRQIEDRAKLQSFKKSQHFGASENRLKPEPSVLSPSKVDKDRNANPIQKLRVSSGEDAGKSSGSHVRTSEHKLKSGVVVRDYIEDAGKSSGSHVRTSEHKLKSGVVVRDYIEDAGKSSDSHVRTSEHKLKSGAVKDYIEDVGKFSGSHVRTSEHKLKSGAVKDYIEDAGKFSGSHVRTSEHKLKPGIVKDYIEQGREIYNSMSNLSKNAPMLYNKAAPVVGQGNGTESDSQVLKAARPDKDLVGLDRGISTKPNLSMQNKLCDEGVSKPAPKKEIITDFQVHEVTERPHDHRSRWFNFRASWQEKIADAHQKGTLVLFQNLDPSYTSKEIEDLVWSALGEKCNAGVVQQTTYSSPHNGKAFVVFDTTRSADAVLTKLHSGCLMLPNGRPLVAEVGFPVRPGKQPKFVGHLSIEKLDNQKQREEKKNAVSTAHFPQPNTIEFEMAMEWILLQKRSEQQLEALYEGHGKQLSDLKDQLKNKLN